MLEREGFEACFTGLTGHLIFEDGSYCAMLLRAAPNLQKQHNRIWQGQILERDLHCASTNI